MQAETLNCPTCGAATMTDATHCLFCNARLATVACPSCFAMMFVGSKHCSRCGVKVERAEAVEAVSRKCPRCLTEMETLAVGNASLRECARCDGIWVDVDSFERIMAEREEQAAVLGAASHVPKHDGAHADPNRVRYVPCPECHQLMNRVNFARCSGVIVDVCKGHGTWFDRDELQQIIEFIRGGGLGVSREREKREPEERERLRQEQLAATMRNQSLLNIGIDDDDRVSGMAHAARELFRLFKSSGQ